MDNADKFVFPATDSLLSWQTRTVPNTSKIQSDINRHANTDIETSLLTADTNSRNALSYGMYLSRNKTISHIADDMIKQNSRYDNGASETYARQGEINEWQAQNKLDTFFFLQSTFIYLMIVILLIFLRRFGVLPSSSFYSILIFLTLILIGIFYNRASYTIFSRDKRYWNRRYLSLNAAAIPPPPACPTSDNSVNLDTLGEQASDYLFGTNDEEQNSAIRVTSSSADPFVDISKNVLHGAPY
jgi:hypothetical protein